MKSCVNVSLTPNRAQSLGQSVLHRQSYVRPHIKTSSTPHDVRTSESATCPQSTQLSATDTPQDALSARSPLLRASCSNQPSTSYEKLTTQQQALNARSALLGVAALCSFALVCPPNGWCSGDAKLSGGALELFRQFLESIESLGPMGPVIFVLVVMLAEMIPLFPSQPLALASGLLFGPVQGSFVMCLAMMLAAFNAFSLSRGVGRSLAQKVIAHEVGEGGLVQQKLAEVTAVIERGGFWRQLSAICLLRLTPVVPFSASNYVLGVTPLKMAPYLLGTLGGVSFWSVLYASLGGASRSLLDGGMDMELLLADLAAKAGSYTQTFAVTAGGIALLAAGYMLINRVLRGNADKATAQHATSSSVSPNTAATSGSDMLQTEGGVGVSQTESVVQGEAGGQQAENTPAPRPSAL